MSKLRIAYIFLIGVFISGYYFLFKYSYLLEGHTLCFFKSITGVPCPSCGSTRATLEIFKGNFLKSIFINPLAIVTNIFFFISLFWLIKDFVKNERTFLQFLKKDWYLRTKILFLILILLNWFWNIKKGL